MCKIQLERVKWLSFEVIIDRIVEIVSRKRMADISHMDTNLMGPSCFQMKLCK